MSDEYFSEGFLESRAGGAFRLQPGVQIGDFELLQLLGEGGCGQAWQARGSSRRAKSHDGLAVLKFLPESLRFHKLAVQRLEREFDRVMPLKHRGLCLLHELGHHEGAGPYLVMEYLRGSTLRVLLEPYLGDGLPVDRAFRYLSQAASALDYAHHRGVIHRDIKPENMLVVESDDELQLIDFGLASEVRESLSQFSAGSSSQSGTEPYMAPEQWSGLKQDSRCDQWALGIIAWELLTGERPFHGSGHQLGFAIINASVPELPSELSGYQSVFERVFSKAPGDRFGSCEEFVAALSNTGSGGPALAAARPEPQGSASPSQVSPVDDLATVLQKTQESVSRKHAQAKQLIQNHDYGKAVEILDSIPDHLRDESLTAEARRKRDRSAELDSSIRTSVKEVRLDGVNTQIEELLELQPHREDLRRLQAQLPKAPPSPPRPSLLVAPFDSRQAAAAQEAWAKHLGVSVEVSNSLGMKFRVIPPGTFDMGSPTSEPKRSNDETLHKVTITQPKLLGVYPVTQGEWTRVMGSNPSHFKSVSGQDTSRFPVECVSWEDCQEFLRKLNAEHGLEGFRYRLPTEAEWEYACRAGTVTPFWFGGELNGQQANCDGNYPYQTGKGPYLERPSVVGSYGANPFGVYDQHGQVWEWCGDWYDGDYDSSSPVEDPQGASSGSSRVLRGGSWFNFAFLCRSADRRADGPSLRYVNVGFRVLCELS